jgi:hypothetical protein
MSDEGSPKFVRHSEPDSEGESEVDVEHSGSESSSQEIAYRYGVPTAFKAPRKRKRWTALQAPPRKKPYAIPPPLCSSLISSLYGRV